VLLRLSDGTTMTAVEMSSTNSTLRYVRSTSKSKDGEGWYAMLVGIDVDASVDRVYSRNAIAPRLGM
jgi:hypothetical protein